MKYYKCPKCGKKGLIRHGIWLDEEQEYKFSFECKYCSYLAITHSVAWDDDIEAEFLEGLKKKVIKDEFCCLLIFPNSHSVMESNFESVFHAERWGLRRVKLDYNNLKNITKKPSNGTPFNLIKGFVKSIDFEVFYIENPTLLNQIKRCKVYNLYIFEQGGKR